MKQIGVLLTRNYKLLSIAAILEVFETVNYYDKNAEKAPSFQINVLTDEQAAAEQRESFGYDSKP